MANNHELDKLKQALGNIESLADEVEKGLFLPKRFRKAPFTPELKAGYVKYLRSEASDLKRRIKQMDRSNQNNKTETPTA
jgi:hypothetical protein